jgi:predicted nucleotidyltransferase component of viral defense system
MPRWVQIHAVEFSLDSPLDVEKSSKMKGGTAINKLYLGETSRLSVDLDFNHLGPKDDGRKAVQES